MLLQRDVHGGVSCSVLFEVRTDANREYQLLSNRTQMQPTPDAILQLEDEFWGSDAWGVVDTCR